MSSIKTTNHQPLTHRQINTHSPTFINLLKLEQLKVAGLFKYV